MKKLILMLASIMTMHVVAEELFPNEKGNKWDTTQVYGERGVKNEPFFVGFEFSNSALAPVWLQVINGKNKSKIYRVAPAPNWEQQPTLNFTIDTTEPTYLRVWNEEPADEARKNEPFRLFSFSPSKTIYVTWDPSSQNFLKPTVGLFGKTRSNLSVKNNLSQQDITAESSFIQRSLLEKEKGGQPQPKELFPNEQGNAWDTTKVYGESGDKPGKPFLVGFELSNGSEAPVWIKVMNGKDASKVYQVAPATKGIFTTEKPRINFSTDSAEPTYLLLWTKEPAATQKQPSKMFSFTPLKTVYVTWNPSSKEPLSPTGGTFGRTTSNLSLKRNVSQNDITLEPLARVRTLLGLPPQKIASPIEVFKGLREGAVRKEQGVR